MTRAACGLGDSGFETAFELIIRFNGWANQRKPWPSIDDIRDEFGVSRATAYRWRKAWADANGIRLEPTHAI